MLNKCKKHIKFEKKFYLFIKFQFQVSEQRAHIWGVSASGQSLHSKQRISLSESSPWNYPRLLRSQLRAGNSCLSFILYFDGLVFRKQYNFAISESNYFQNCHFLQM